MTPDQAVVKIEALCRESHGPDFLVKAADIMGILRLVEMDLVPTQSPTWGVPMPWHLRWRYGLMALRGDVRVTGLVNLTHIETEGYVEATVRVRADGGTWRD